MLNSIVQLPCFSEADEMRIFRHSVLTVLAAIESLLPSPYLDLCRRRPEHEHDGLSEAVATRLFERLTRATESLTLPYLDAHHEWQVVHCVLELLVGAMRENSSFDDILRIERSGPIMMRTFVKGSAGELITQRSAIAETLASDLSVPLIPTSWKLWLCSKVVDATAEQLEQAIMEAYQASLLHVNAAADADLSLARARRAHRAATAAVATAKEKEVALLRERAELFRVGFRYTHGARGAGTVTAVKENGVRVVTFDNGEVHRYRPLSQHKLQPIYAHAPTAAAHCNRKAEEAAAAAHAHSEDAKAKALLAEESTAAVEAEHASALEAELACQVAVPFAERVQSHIVASLQQRLPTLLPAAASERAIRFAIELALTSSFNSQHMSQACDYLLDQHRLARRLARVPTGARELLLRRKEVIYSTLVAMDADGSNTIDENEFVNGVHRLGLPLDASQARELFLALDVEGGGVVRPESLETLLFGVRLSAEHRRALHRTAQLRRKQWDGEVVDEYRVAEAERAGHRFSQHDGGGGGGGGRVSFASFMPLALLGLVRGRTASASSADVERLQAAHSEPRPPPPREPQQQQPA